MLSRNNWLGLGILWAAVALFGACGYEPPTVGLESTSSSSSSSGMGGDGAKEPTGSVSSSGNGGFGGMPAGVGGLGGVGGIGGASVTSSSSTGGSGMGGSPPADPIVQNCGNGDCDTSAANSVCCKRKDGSQANCNTITGICWDMMEYALKCDDKPDCGAEYCCLGANGRATCNANCTTMVICKVKADCPPDKDCNATIMGGLLACGAP